jgi:hypothetical protein
LIAALPPADGVKLTWHLADATPALVAGRSQTPAFENEPVGDEKVTVPWGESTPTANVSVTVAVQVVAEPVVAGEGLHASDVAVAWGAADAGAAAPSAAARTTSACKPMKRTRRKTAYSGITSW